MYSLLRGGFLVGFAMSTFTTHASTGIMRLEWGTHASGNQNDSLLYENGYSSASSPYQLLQKLSPTGVLESSGIDGGLIELGFFDKSGGGIDATTSSSAYDFFQGVWTPITSETTIGADWTDGTSGQENKPSTTASRTVPRGEFYFITDFSSLADDGSDATQSNTNTSLHGAYNSEIVDDSITASDLQARIGALGSQSDSTLSSNPLIGMRFYDSASKSNGVRYNTIMNTNWRWEEFPTAGTENVGPFTLYNSSGDLDTTNLKFEFDNSVGNSRGSKVGSNTLVTSELFASTITYYDGSSGIDLSGSSDILSGLAGSGTIGLGDGGTYTLHAYDFNNSISFTGNIIKQGGGSANAYVIKSGTGAQELTGELKLEGSSAGLMIDDGYLSLQGSAGTQIVESIIALGGTSPTLELDNTNSAGGQIVQIGLSQTWTADFNGSVDLRGTNGTENKIKIARSLGDDGFAATDYNRTQSFSGVVSSTGTNKLVKDGTGQLVLSGNNTFTGGVVIKDGTVVAGHENALGSTNAVTISKGKFEVDSGITLTNGATITAEDSDKTMIGGRGDLNNDITIGSADGQIDVISPGDGISSSLSSTSSHQQVSLGDRENAIGTFTVDELTLANGAVFDWEISDFTGSAGSDWDILRFDSLVYNPNDTVVLNIFSLSADGSAGQMGGGDVWASYQQSSGFKFMEFTGTKSWGGDPGAAGTLDNFTIQDNGWQHYNNMHLNQWSVYWDGTSAFYLQYSAVPEPSTYIMVTGLLMVPGMSYVRRYRNKKKGIEAGEENQSS